MRSVVSRVLPVLVASIALSVAPGTTVVAGSCTLATLAELKVTMIGPQPLVHALINGADALFVVDSGAFYSWLTPAAAAQFGLHLEVAPPAWAVQGMGGATRPFIAKVTDFAVADQHIHDIEFLVLGNDLGNGAAGTFGQNLLRIADLEYDLANGVIRFTRPQDCKTAMMAYWVDVGAPYSVIDIDAATPAQPHTSGFAYVNGTKIHVMFDTGASTSILTLEAAKRAGVTPQTSGVVTGGAQSGIGHNYVPTWIAPFGSFKIGDEEVRNTLLRIGGTGPGPDMLIGADFFLSHHIYVASSQRKLYFTYNGGPVFNLASLPATAAAQSVPTGDGASTTSPLPVRADDPNNAAGFARRGSAYAARHEYEQGVADLTRAIALAPTESSYFYQRGLAHWGNQQADLALADFDQAIKLKPDDVPALVARAELRASRQEAPELVAADVDTADRAAPKEAEVRLRLGDLYQYAGQYPGAVVQYSKWIESHPRGDVHQVQALTARCRARALWGQQLDQALSDCDSALKEQPKSTTTLDSRALVYERRGDYDKAVADYDAALRLQPKSAWSLYGRGVAKLRKGLTDQGHADIAAATTLQPKIAEQAGRLGLGP
jgi:tetratricopeptide (TPR) repeat protein/predicted aspartyl protease